MRLNELVTQLTVISEKYGDIDVHVVSALRGNSFDTRRVEDASVIDDINGKPLALIRMHK